MALVAVILERLDRQRTEEFLGHREARQQALEIAGVAEGCVQAACQFAFGGARGADQQRVLAGQRGEQAQAHALAAFDEAVFENIEQGPQAGRKGEVHEARL
jgi:hypothetical protein